MKTIHQIISTLKIYYLGIRYYAVLILIRLLKVSYKIVLNKH
jgi:hypothetical protein